MKKTLLITFLLLLTIATSVVGFTSCASSESDVITLYVYNWGEYISDGSEGSLDVNRAFEEYYAKKHPGKTVKVNYSTFSSNESMYAKVSSGSTAYDVIIPSDYMIDRMVKEGLLQPLDMDKIPNYAYVADEFKGENVYYEGNKTGDNPPIYSVPYFYGMIGVIYNTSIVDPDDKQIGSWDLMWDKDYKGNILQFNNSRDAFGTALLKLGYDLNDVTEEQWNEALELLMEQKEIVQGYVMDEIFNKMQSGSAAVAAYYAGDYLSMHEKNEDLAFFYPTEGTNMYVDAMCVPKNAQNPDVAMEYINFMCSEEIAVANALYTYYASPMTHVRQSEEYKSEMGEEAYDILYGESAQEALENSKYYLNLPTEDLERLNLLWEQLKSKSRIGNGIYVFCGVILGALALLGIWQFLKKRRWAKLYD
ncbi:MAG: spermidine/putrescine ABC transporter substrate-binding protein [Clostridia bacterium]|nr:spermidine/putrescine ABC transporter substrate-binding protein [Clostridia bacterium]